MKYQPLRKADANQAKALKKMRGKEAFALLMAMRTRKTKVALDDFGEMELAGSVKDMLVIAPGGCYRTWEGAMGADLSHDIQDRMLRHTYSSGAGVYDKRQLEHFLKTLDPSRPRVLLMNIEALSRPGPGRELAKTFVKQRDCVVPIDESTRVKNKSKRTDFVIKSIRPAAAVRRIMSGLATPRSPLDLFYQFEYLDWEILGFRSWYAFRSHVAFMKTQWFGGRRVELVDQDQGENGFRPEAVKELQKLIEPHSFRVEFRPKVPTTYSIHYVEMTAEQQRAYAEMRDFATTKLSEMSHVTATVVIAQITKMHQILLGHVGDEQHVEQILPENRTSELLGILADYGGKAIIWFSYDHDLRKVYDALIKDYGERSTARFWGGNTKTRDQERDRFLCDPKCRFILATPDSGALGQTWDIADLVIYYSSRDNLEHRDQSEMRAMGQDKTRGVDVIDMICDGTVEGLILQALRKKINTATTINGDNWRSWVV